MISTEEKIKEIGINEVVYRKDLYPRFEPNQVLIERYADSIEQLPPIRVNQNNILIDGFHRWKAHQLKKKETIKAEVIETESEKELRKLAYQYNSNHGLQLSNEEKRSYAQEMIGVMSIDDLSKILSVSYSTIRDWTTTQRKNLEEERNKKILNLYLKCWTQRQIAEALGIDDKTVSNILRNYSESVKIPQNFKPFLYNIWNLSKQDNNNGSHFGSFPLTYMKNLLYYHTEPFDIVYDPFAGGGTTIDACKEMLRRYYCSDLIVRPGREDDIKQWNINDGLPEDLPKPDLAFLDPPYWKQARNKYSEDSEDLANIELDKFYEQIERLLKELSNRKIERIAIVIAPTQYPNDMNFEDHIFKFNEMLKEKYQIEMRYSLPYSTQQYNGTQVEVAKEQQKPLSILRDLIVWCKK